MPIVTLQPEHVETVYALYRRATREAPHCRFVPGPQRFADELLHALPAHAQVLVSLDGGQARGLAALRQQDTGDGGPDGEVTALFVDDARAGLQLLDVVLSRARALGFRRLAAFPPQHFHSLITGYNAGWDGLSDRLGLVAHLLTRQGFAPFYRELHLEWTGALAPLAPPSTPVGIKVGICSTPDGGISAVALDAAGEVGVCDYSLLTRLSDDPAAAHWGYVWNLEVHERARRRGIGRFLMNTALARLSASGCQGCWLTTGAANWPAQALYFSLGFTVVDASTCFQLSMPTDG